MIGKILGNRYRVLREVGSGGMAWVYLAEDINEGRLVAIKILYPQFGEDIAYIQRFNREAKLASTLSDRHIVRVLDYGATRDVHYLVMEYIEGQDLRSLIEERGSLPWRESLQLVDQLAIALEHAHLHGIIHRDIKPQNLMITDDGVLKVLDFGIARARMLPSLTQSGFVGSPYYISPEQAMGEEVDIRSDIYSAGIVLFEALSGRVPYDAASPWSIISQHIASEPPRVEQIENHVPEAIGSVLQRMIAKRPEDRFQTPTALREAIACVLEDRPIPDALRAPAPASPDRGTTAEGLYRRALEAIKQEDWQLAVDLLNQVLKLVPEHTEAAAKLSHAGRQARMAALYEAACRAMEASRWQEAIDELSEVISVEPNYRDARDLLDRVRVAQEKGNIAHDVSSLYEKGLEYIKAGEWEKAAYCFRQVQQLSPGYKQTQMLLAKTEGNLTSSHRRTALWRNTLKRVVQTIAIVLVLLAVISSAYFVSQSSNTIGADDPAGVSTDLLATMYGEAQTALQTRDWDKAIELLNRILAQDPGYKDADALQKQAETNHALEQLFSQGQADYLSRRWDESIDTLNQLRQTDTTFRAAEVQEMLCDAYLQRGRGYVATHAEASEGTLIETALEDFETGLVLCPDNQDLSAQHAYANGFFNALKSEALEDWNSVIGELAAIVATEPNYANGNARRMLYTALVTRGDIHRQAGDLTGAISDYEYAIALDQVDTLNAVSRRSVALQALNNRTSPTNAQPEHPVTVTPPSYIYAAPNLVAPESESLFQGEFTPVLLEWESVGILAEDEYYDVTVMHFMGEEPRYWGDAVKETQWLVPVEVGFGVAGNDRFYWWVTVRKANTAPNPDELDIALSPSSDARTFYWGD